MHELGRERYWSGVRQARQDGEETRTRAGRYLLRESVQACADALEGWLAHAAKTSGPRHGAHAHLSMIDSELASAICGRILLDEVAADRSYSTLAVLVGSRLEDELRFERFRTNHGRLWNRVRRQQRHANRYHLRKVLRAVVAEHMADWEPWSLADRTRAGAVLVDLFIGSTGLFEVVSERRGKRQVDRVQPREETLMWLEQSHEHHQSLHPFYLPMCCPPVDWGPGELGGYVGNLVRRQPLVRTRGSEPQPQVEAAEMPTVYRAINLLQNTAWRIRPDVLEVLEAEWEAGGGAGVLPERDPRPLPPKPEGMDEDPLLLAQWKGQAAPVHQHNGIMRGRRLSLIRLLFVAREFSTQAKIYFPYQLDFRGRMYAVPQFLNPQGSDVARGLLSFADGIPITEPEHVSALALHGANCFGMRGSLAQRSSWVGEHSKAIVDCARRPLVNNLWREADKPWQFLAFCFEWLGWKQAGYGFRSRLPCMVDGTNNGLQLYALITRDAQLGELTNCGSSSYDLEPEDLYMTVLRDLLGRLNVTSARWGYRWRAFLLSLTWGKKRKLTKRPVMTVPYGINRFACLKMVQEWFDDLTYSGEHADTFGEQRGAALQWLAGELWEVIQARVGPALEVMDWLGAAVRPRLDAGLGAVWTSPSGFPVVQDYRKSRSRVIRTVLGESVRSLRVLENQYAVDPRQHRKGVAPNFIHSLDAAALALTIDRVAFMGCTAFAAVHDAYGVHAARAPMLNLAVRRAFKEVAESDPLRSFAADCLRGVPDTIRLPSLPKMGSLDPADLFRSSYFFS